MSQVDEFHMGNFDEYPPRGVPHPGAASDCPLCPTVEWYAQPIVAYQMQCAKCRNHAGPVLHSEKAIRQWLHMRSKPCKYCEREAS